jgi:hypothetical protein
LSQREIGYRMLDNALGWIADFDQAQKLADEFRVEMLHRHLDGFAARYCPVLKQFELSYHWSLDQVEFATDVVLAKQADLQAIYDRLTRTAIHTVKPDNIATFLGRKLHSNYQDEMGNRFNTRIEGTRIQHTLGPVSIKMYDKFRLILRIETTVVNVSFFQHYREVEHQDGTRRMAWAEMKKSIYSLAPLRELLLAAHRRYLEFISAIEDDKAGADRLNKISQPVRENDRAYRGFNLFDPDDEQLFRALARGECNISGFQNKDLRRRNERQKQWPDLTDHETSWRAWPSQKGRPHLPLLPHRARQTSHRAWPQAKGTLYYSRPRHRTGLLNSCQVRSQSIGMGTKSFCSHGAHIGSPFSWHYGLAARAAPHSEPGLARSG